MIFLAGLSNDPMAEFSPSKNFIFNASAPAYLAYIAKAAGVKRYIYASSCSVYGYTENELFDEDAAGKLVLSLRHFQAARRASRDADGGLEFFGDFAAQRNDLRLQPAHALRSDRQHHVQERHERRRHQCQQSLDLAAICSASKTPRRPTSAPSKLTRSFPEFSMWLQATTRWAKSATWCELPSRNGWGCDLDVHIQHIQDFRNYKVSIEKAKNVLSFHPNDDVKSIVRQSDR